MAEAEVLLVDDDEALARVLGVGFESRGYDLRVAPTGADGIRAVEEHDVDVIILDLGLPDLDGIEVCRHLRQRTRTPIIVLSADGAEERKVRALDEGADDYLTKPFSMPELLARVRVAVRHRRALAAVVDDEVLTVGSLTLDAGAHEAILDGRPVDLTPKEYALVLLLVRNVGKVLTHRAILDQVWGADQPLDTLRTHVSHLRRKLGSADGAPTLVTAPGVGYRLLAPGDSVG
jgi:two-component system, OmpR family, KDP operon response regulator KdpE